MLQKVKNYQMLESWGFKTKVSRILNRPQRVITRLWHFFQRDMLPEDQYHIRRE